MAGYKNILVAIDFSPLSYTALDKAFEVAAQLGATVHVLHAFTLQDKPEAEVAAQGGLDKASAGEHDKLERAVAPHRASGKLGQVLWQDGDPASEIVSSAEKVSAELIVLGASGRTGIQRLLLGSVAEAVTRDARCSVLIVR